MTVSSKQNSKAEVVELPSMRHSTAGKSASIRSRRSVHKPGVTAALVSVREHLKFKASIGINDLAFIEQSYSPQVADKLMSKIRGLLDKEFGHLRVYRRHQVFVVRHHSLESLITGLLTVQFYSCQIPMPVTHDGEGMSDICGIPVSWGVGRSQAEADSDRLRKLNEKA